jgi:hypothetical protein
MSDDRYRDARAYAADLAVRSLTPGTASQDTARAWASFWLGWLLAPQTTSLRATLIVTGPAGQVKTTLTSTDGGTMSTAMTIDDTVTVTLATDDDHGDPTSDTLSASTSDNGSVMTWASDGDVWTGTPVAEGESVLTVSDPAAPDVAPFVADVTVGPGATSSITGTVTVNTGANATPPAAG